MSLPDKRQIHVDTFLSNLSVAFANDASAFIATQVFPEVTVQKQSDLYPVYNRDSFFRARAQIRDKGAESAGDGWETTNQTYYAVRRDFHYDIHDDDRQNADPIFNLEQDATEFITNAMLLTREETWMTTYFQAGIWDNELTGVSGAPGASQFQQWNESASTPISDIRNMADSIHQVTGFRPNTLVLSPQVLTALEENDSIRDRIKYTTNASVTEETLARLFRVDRVLIANAVYDASDAGAALDMQFMAGKSALLCYSAPRPSLKQPSAGYTFSWRLPETGGSTAISIRNFRMELLNSDRVEGSMAYDQKVVASDMGGFFATAIA